jgi:hypothetical protein
MSQITVTLFDGKSPQVEYVTAGENVNKTINELREKTDNISPEALAKGVRVNRNVFEVPSSRVFEWLQGLSASLGPSLTALTSEAENRYHTGIPLGSWRIAHGRLGGEG